MKPATWRWEYDFNRCVRGQQPATCSCAERIQPLVKISPHRAEDSQLFVLVWYSIRIYLEKIKNLRLYKWGVQQGVFTQFAFVNTFCAWSDNASCREKYSTYPYRLLLRTSQRKQSRYQQWEGVDSLCSNDTWKLQYLLDFCWCRSSVNEDDVVISDNVIPLF